MSTAAPKGPRLPVNHRDSGMTSFDLARYRTEETNDPDQLAVEQAEYRARWGRSAKT